MAWFRICKGYRWSKRQVLDSISSPLQHAWERVCKRMVHKMGCCCSYCINTYLNTFRYHAEILRGWTYRSCQRLIWFYLGRCTFVRRLLVYIGLWQTLGVCGKLSTFRLCGAGVAHSIFLRKIWSQPRAFFVAWIWRDEVCGLFVWHGTPWQFIFSFGTHCVPSGRRVPCAKFVATLWKMWELS